MRFFFFLNVNIMCKISKQSWEWIQSYDCVPQLDLEWPICSKWQFFSENPLIQFPCTSWLLFIVHNFKKILRVDPKLWRHVIFRPKMALKYIFFRKPISKPSHVHSCLSTYKKPESDVSTLLRYWWLKNTEIWFSRSICGHNLRTRFFPHMWFLQNAKGS